MGTTLREIRKLQGKVLQDVARATNLHTSTIQRIEHGQLPQSFDRIEQLASCYDLDVGEFVVAVYTAHKRFAARAQVANA